MSWDPNWGMFRARPLVTGNRDFVMRVTDSAGNTATRLIPWRVTSIGAYYSNQSLPVGGTATPVLGKPYAQPLILLGGTLPYTVTPVNLAGLSVDADGMVSGTAAEAGRFLPFSFNIQDSSIPPNNYSWSGNITVDAPSTTTLALTGGDFGVFQKGVQSTITLFAGGSPVNPPNFVVTILSGSLPPGLRLLTVGDFNNVGDITRAAQIAGIPTTTGSFSALLNVQDAAANIGQRQLKFRVSDIGFVTTGVAPGTVGVPYTQTFEVRGGTMPYTFTSNVTLPGGLSLNALTGTLSGTPTSSNSTSFGLVVTDANGDSIVRNYTVNIYDIQITNPNLLPNAIFGESYTVNFAALPAGPYAWTATGLPTGLTLDPVTGVLSGAPIGTGTFTVTVTAGTSSHAVNKTFTLIVASRSISTILTGLPTASLGDFVVGAFVNTILGIVGGTPPYTISVVAGSALPPGLALAPSNTASGTAGFGRTAIVGIPTTKGSYSFQLRYSDSAGVSVVRTVTMRVSGLALATTTPGLGTVNVPYTTQLFGSGGTGSYMFALADGLTNVLAPGLSLSASGVISGTPTATGTFTTTILLSDGVDTRQQNITITINATSDLRRIDFAFGPILVDAPMGRAFTSTFNPTGGSGTHTWSVVSGLPPGMQLRAGSTLPAGFTPPTAFFTGVPTTPGTFTVRIRVDDSTGNFGIRTATMKVTPLRFAPATVPHTLGVTLPPLQEGSPYSFTFTAYNKTGTLTFEPLLGAFMPAGVSLNSTGVLSGTPSETGNFLEPFRMTDSGGNSIQTTGLGLSVYPAGRPIGVNGLTVATLANATKGIPYTKNLNDLLIPGYGTAPFNWTVTSGSLPDGMSIVGNLLTGTPTATGSSTFTLKATDANGTQHVIPGLVLAVATMSMSPAPGVLPPAIAGVPYTQTFVAAGGISPITFRLGFGSDLPVGLTLSSGGVLSGIPTTSGPFSLLIEAVDITGATFLQRYTLNVAPVGTVFPSLTAVPSSINLNYVRGNPNPAPIPVNVGSTSGTLNFTAEAAGGSWISVAPGSGSTPGFVTLSFSMTGLAAGVYNGALNVTAASAVNSPLSLPVMLTVTDALPCSFALNPASSSIGAAGGSLSFDVTTDQACNWTASTTASFITINSPGSGTGTGTVNLSIQPNTTSNTRSGSVTVQGLTYTVTQFGTACSFTLIPNSINVDSFGGVGTISVQASDSTCAWTATQTDSWISANPPNATGSVNVDVTVQSTNSTSSRVGSITIGGQPLTVNQAGLGCYYFLSSSGSPSFSSSGGTTSVDLTTPAGCAWKTDAGPSWIKVTAGQSGFSSGKVTLSIAPNSSTAARSATVLIADQEYDVSQDGVSCSFSVGVDNTLFAVGGGAGSIAITATPKVAGGFCPWVVSSNAPWLTPAVSSGNGSQNVSFNVTANGGTAARSATLNVAGQNIVITESGPVCEFNLRSSAASMPFGGGANSAGVVTANGCGWVATSNAPFIEISSGTPGTGTGDVNFNVQPNNTGTDRVGSLTIAGKTFTVTQAKAPCSIVLGSGTFNAGPFGGAGSFSYTTTVSNCEHTVLSYSSMLNVTSATYSGTAGTVNFSVDPNGFAAARSGVIRVGEESFTVNQDPSPCQYTLTLFSATFDRLGGPGSIPMTFAPAACGPAGAVIKGPASMITLGDVLKDGSTYNQLFTSAIYQSFINYTRTAQIIINGQIFTVKQTSW